MASRRRDSTADKNRLVERILSFGFEMPRPCNRCSRSKKKCVILSKSARCCGECVRLGRSCSFVTPDLDWDKLVDATNRIEREEAETRARVSELFARLNRLEKQKNLLRSHAGKFLQSDLQTVEELEKQEEEEERNRRETENDQRLLTLESIDLFNATFGSIDSGDLPSLDLSVLDPSDHSVRLSSEHS